MGIEPQQFEAMRRRVAGERLRRRPAPVLPGAAGGGGRVHRVILGVDPSLRGTGYGLVRVERTGMKALGHGTIRCPSSWMRSRCLAKIAEEIRAVVGRHGPTVCAIEGLFYAQNLQTALLMGEARGACLAAVAEAGLEVFELAPRRVKQAVVGYGAAQKDAVARMIQRLLDLEVLPEPDAADALALAVAYAQECRAGVLSPLKAI
ncbi:MAG TPA: crossover junction endodeoxyribonuclease RuvC [Candidatus Paceibacterota bacterium]|nr:crossover junction endodeoxyribonuclease RuvC [Verrucomicrobiota bacterium]HOX01074.1 crossover junction endodeoxyribonuclease RuvC [Verrucomicrobiota bacterium]HRZ43822.1 crossover junction endodeoxyribonuclease RuvC [Candidatus Paceibacterota bacterium]HRZ92626.1 crossover junction endodeoxyribonuclease RuvC [Candidatus Paceibacterota bacterium]